jgi:hypothetical protein
VFTSKAAVTTAAGNLTLLRKEQWLEEGALKTEGESIQGINIGAMDIEQLLLEAKKRIKEKASLDDDYRAIYNS